jgi:hypothetical protein
MSDEEGPGGHNCELCEKNFKSAGGLSRHKTMVHTLLDMSTQRLVYAGMVCGRGLANDFKTFLWRLPEGLVNGNDGSIKIVFNTTLTEVKSATLNYKTPGRGLDKTEDLGVKRFTLVTPPATARGGGGAAAAAGGAGAAASGDHLEDIIGLVQKLKLDDLPPTERKKYILAKVCDYCSELFNAASIDYHIRTMHPGKR